MVVHFPASDLLVYRSVGFPTIGYINPYYWVDDHPLLYGNIGSLDPIAHVFCFCLRIPGHECVQQLFGSCMTVLRGGAVTLTRSRPGPPKGGVQYMVDPSYVEKEPGHLEMRHA